MISVRNALQIIEDEYGCVVLPYIKQMIKDDLKLRNLLKDVECQFQVLEVMIAMELEKLSLGFDEPNTPEIVLLRKQAIIGIVLREKPERDVLHKRIETLKKHINMRLKKEQPWINGARKMIENHVGERNINRFAVKDM